MTTSRLAVVLLTCSLGSCKKSGDVEKTGATGSAPPLAAEPAIPPPASGSTKWLALGMFGIEVEAPACADITPIDTSSVSVTPKDPSCELPFPGVVFSKPLTEAKGLDEEVATALQGTPKPEITRKDKTANGWVVEWKTAATGDDAARAGITMRYAFGDKQVACTGDLTKNAEVVRRVCGSAREKK